MGLQSHPSDVSSESILLFTVVLVAQSVSYLHSLLVTILRSVGGGVFAPDDHHRSFGGGSLRDAVGSGLAGFILFCDQFDWSNSDAIGGVDFDADCVVCLNRLGEADRLRRLACRHVFHEDCLNRWLDYLNFSCPLCRAPLEGDEWARRRVEEDLLVWSPFQ